MKQVPTLIEQLQTLVLTLQKCQDNQIHVKKIECPTELYNFMLENLGWRSMPAGIVENRNLMPGCPYVEVADITPGMVQSAVQTD